LKVDSTTNVVALLRTRTPQRHIWIDGVDEMMIQYSKKWLRFNDIN